MYPGENTQSGTPLIRVGDVAEGGVVRAPTMRISDDVHKEYLRTELRGDELLITLVGKPGVCVLVRPEMKGWNIARALAAARLKSPELRSYIKAVLESSVMRNIILSMLNTTVQPTLNLKEIKTLPVPMPDDVREALAIGAFTEVLNSRIAILQETNTTLEAIAQAMFKSRFVDFDPVHAKAEGREPEGMDAAAAALFPCEFEESELGLIPKGWRVDDIGKVVLCLGGATPSTKELRYWDNPVHHWVTPKDLSGLEVPVLIDTERMVSDSGLAKISSGLLPVGTLLLSSRAPIGYLAIAHVPTAINQGFIAMLPGGELPASYLLFWTKLNMDGIKQKANGSTFMEISKSAFRPIKVAVPPSQVVGAFDAIAKPLLDRIAENERQRRQLAQLRDTLLPRLISGKLRLSESEALIEEATI